MQCQSKVLVWLQKHCSVPAHSHSKVVKYCSFVKASAVSEICTWYSFSSLPDALDNTEATLSLPARI